MTGKQRMIHALERRAPIAGEHAPHFELVFFLTMEELGLIHPNQRHYSQWGQFSEAERQLHRQNSVDCYLEIAKRYNHDAIFLHPNPGSEEEGIRLMTMIREQSGDDYFILRYGDTTYEIPNGSDMIEFAAAFAEEPERMKREASRRIDEEEKRMERLAKHPGLFDGFAMCSDYCFNTAPFFPPAQFAEFVTPYLERLIKVYRDAGYYTIKHTDGNIMPIIDQLVACKPDALHSLDPQGGVDLAEVKRLYGDQITLVGNVNCGLLQTGTDEEVAADVRRALRDGMPGGGYIFSTSNCVYSGMPLERYRLMHRIWREEGMY